MNRRRGAVLFADGEENFLNAIIRELPNAPYDFFKSSAECSPTEAALDKMRSFAIIHSFMRSKEFVKLLQTHDKDYPPREHALMKMANEQLPSRRVVSRFYLSWDRILSKAYTMPTITKGWLDIHFNPFNQNGVLDNCPSYRNLTEDEKSDLAFRMPRLMKMAAASGVGYATDDQIFEVLGDIVGRPNRDPNPEAKEVRKLETMNIGRGRAGFFTAPGMEKALADRAQYLADIVAEKEEKKRLKEARRLANKLKRGTSAYKRGIGRMRRGMEECEACMWKINGVPTRLFITCETCPRKFCSEPSCLSHYQNIHFPVCLQASTLDTDVIMAAATTELMQRELREGQVSCMEAVEEEDDEDKDDIFID